MSQSEKQKNLEKLFRGVMGETVHTAFRKGSDHEDSGKVWKVINEMNPEAWSECCGWMAWALAYSLENRLELTAREAKNSHRE